MIERDAIARSLWMLEAVLQGIQNLSDGPTDRWWKTSPVHVPPTAICGVMTRDGKTCRYRVAETGLRCGHHRNRSCAPRFAA